MVCSHNDLPGIYLLMLSTSYIMIALSKVIQSLIREKSGEVLIERKLKQLKGINKAMVFLYISVASFVVSDLLSGIGDNTKLQLNFTIYILFIGISFAMIAHLSRVLFSFRATRLRQDQYYGRC